jgi:protein phosphatase
MESQEVPRLLTIGAFAKASRLSSKALRLYDELGLLAPARVDATNGYRLYAPEQLEQARLVAWLRRLGMPLADIRHVTTLDAGPAAREIRAFWARVESETATRRDLATFLVDHLQRKDPAVSTDMSTTTERLGIRYAALSDKGLVRRSNQDAVHAGPRLLAVADGYGADGAPASLAALGALKRLESEGVPAAGLLGVLEDAVERAEEAVRTAVGGGAPAAGEDVVAGTTLTAMVWTGSQLALVHIGDSRVYLLREGGLFQITHDHTMVQSMVDQGRLSPEEASSHPERSLLVKALGQGADHSPDMRLHDARPGDRYLLCSDGLSTVVPTAEIRRVLTEVTDPERAVRDLVALANGLGGPDNVSCVVADVFTPEPASA